MNKDIFSAFIPTPFLSLNFCYLRPDGTLVAVTAYFALIVHYAS
jgi:hypothetical protein